MSSPKIREGGCHCGAVTFEVEIPEDPVVTECNCSICGKSGYLHVIVPAGKLKLISGRESLTTYTFGTGVAKHYFCKVCGIKSFYVPRSHPDGFSVNFRCLEGADEIRHTIRAFDGRNWEQHAAELKPLTDSS